MKNSNIFDKLVVYQNKCNIKEYYIYDNYYLHFYANNSLIFDSLIDILRTHFFKKDDIINYTELFSYTVLIDDKLFAELEEKFFRDRDTKEVVLSYCSTEKGTMRAEKKLFTNNDYILKTTKTQSILVSFESKKQYFFIVKNSYLNELTPSKDNYLFFEHILSKTLMNMGYILLHASAIKTNNGVVLFSGEKRSGKTTMFIELIKKEGAIPISVDKVFCQLNSDNTVKVLGFPTRIRILAGTLSKYEDCLELIPQKYKEASIDELWEGKSDGKVDLSVFDFKKYIGQEFETVGILSTIIFPKINKYNIFPYVDFLSQDELLKRLLQVVYSPINPEEDYWSNIGKRELSKHFKTSVSFILKLIKEIDCLVLSAGDNLLPCINDLKSIHKLL